MFHKSDSEEMSSSANPMAPSVFTVALLVKSVSAPAMAAPAPMPSCSFTYFCTVSRNGAWPLTRSTTL